MPDTSLNVTTNLKLLFPDDDNDTEELNAVDDLLGKEMLALDIKERNGLLEEIHGVGCICPQETPEMVAKVLSDLDDEINRIPNSIEKQAYVRSKQFPNGHVHTKSFRMRFLRASLFCIPFVAQRIVTFLHIAVDLFGEVALQRPVRLSDFSDKDLKLLRLGRFQFTPFGDRVGRRIMIYFPDETWESFPPKSKARISLYMSWTAGNDVKTQRKGLVLLTWVEEDMKMSARPKNTLYKDNDLHSTRFSAIHICTPSDTISRFRQAVCKLRIGRSRRVLRQHLGNPIENRYALQSYGISGCQIPISYSGKVKQAYIRQWLGVRSAIEDSYDTLHSNNTHQVIIEYPQPEDVVFRQGSSCTNHPANLLFRNTIMVKVKEQDEAKWVRSGGIKIQRKQILMDVMHEVVVRNGGRFLIWNDNGGWNELLDEGVIHAKIHYLIKEFRKSVRTDLKSREKKVLGSDTSIFRSDHLSQPHEKTMRKCFE